MRRIATDIQQEQNREKLVSAVGLPYQVNRQNGPGDYAKSAF